MGEQQRAGDTDAPVPADAPPAGEAVVAEDAGGGAPAAAEDDPESAVSPPEAAKPAPAPTPADGATQLAVEGHAWLGRIVDDRYRVTELLGEGGMGAVFVAEHLKLRKQVALKVIRAELAGNGEVAIRFAREAMATAQFEHPHVASAIDYGSLPEGGAYFVMQLVRGKSLRQLLSRDQKLPWARAAELAAQVADALSAARSENIVHRDLKPDNILVETREDGSELVKILDFGIAHVAPTDAPAPEGAQANRALTRVGTIMGTPGYMAPEQAVGDKIDHRTDLYALGVVLWECITGQELWDAPDVTAVIARQMTEQVPRLKQLVEDPTLPQELDDLVQRLTARVANDRPEHAGEVRDELRRMTATAGYARPRLSLEDIQQRGRQGADQLARAARKSYVRFRRQPRKTQRIQLGLGAAAVALAAALALLGPEEASAPKKAPEPAAAKKEDDSAITQVVAAAAEVSKTAVEAVKPGPTVPEELEEAVEDMLEGDSVRVRRTAARKIAQYPDQSKIEEYVRVIAELEASRGCRSRRTAIKKMEDIKSDDFLPVLRRYSSAPTTGCGFLSLEDCYSCIRRDLQRAIEAIEGA